MKWRRLGIFIVIGLGLVITAYLIVRDYIRAPNSPSHGVWTTSVVGHPIESPQNLVIAYPQPASTNESDSIVASEDSRELVRSELAEDEAPYGGASVAGRVVNVRQDPIAGWTVFAESLVEGRRKRHVAYMPTDRDGAFTFDELPAGTYSLYARPSDMRTFFSTREQAVQISLAEAEHKTGVTLVFNEGLCITGTVLDTDGVAISGATISAIPAVGTGSEPASEEGKASSSTVSNSDGRFRLVALSAGYYKVIASTQGFESSEVGGVPAGTDGIELVMRGNRVHVSGQVVDAASRSPVSQFNVGFSSYPLGADEAFVPGFVDFKAVNDEQGRFEVSGAQYSGFATLVVQAPGYALSTTPITGLRGSDDISLTVEVVPGGRVLDGTVVGDDGTPIPAAYVFLGPPPVPTTDFENLAVTKSDADGHFRISSIRAQDRVVSALLRFRTPGVTEIPPSREGEPVSVQIILPRDGGLLRGYVTNHGIALTKCILSLNPYGYDETEFTVRHTKPDENGEFVFEDIPDGEYEVAVAITHNTQFDGGVQRTRVWLKQRALVRSSEVTEANFDYRPGSTIVQGLVTIDNHPPAGLPSVCAVRFFDDSGVENTYMVEIDQQSGTYSITGLPSVSAEISVRLDDVESMVRHQYYNHIDIPETGTIDVDFNVTTRDDNENQTLNSQYKGIEAGIVAGVYLNH